MDLTEHLVMSIDIIESLFEADDPELEAELSHAMARIYDVQEGDIVPMRECAAFVSKRLKQMKNGDAEELVMIADLLAYAMRSKTSVPAPPGKKRRKMEVISKAEADATLQSMDTSACMHHKPPAGRRPNGCVWNSMIGKYVATESV